MSAPAPPTRPPVRPPGALRPIRWRRRWRVVVAVVVPLAAGGCGISLQQLPKPGGLQGASYPVRAEFANVLNLPANAQVREGPEVIGQVSDITVSDFQAHVILKIANRTRLPVGTTAEVRFDNPLGEEYVLLQPPAQPNPAFLAAGAVIPVSRTNTAPSVEDTLAALATVLNGGGIAQLGTIIRELNQTFAGNQPQIRSLLSNINGAVTSLAANSGAIDGALDAVGNLFAQLNRGRATIVTGIATIAPAIEVLARENSQFSQLVDGLTRLSDIANTVARQSGQASVGAVKSLLPVVNQIVAVESQLGPDLADIQRFETETPKVAPGNYLQVSVTAQVRINSSPTVASAGAAAAAASVPAGPADGARAVSALLEASLP